MKVLVCGGRKWNQLTRLTHVLGLLQETSGRAITHIIHGNASGADTCASDYARLNAIQEVRCPANWNMHGKAAGPKRNSAMLELKPDLVVAAPGGAGTADMVRKARAAGIPVTEIPE